MKMKTDIGLLTIGLFLMSFSLMAQENDKNELGSIELQVIDRYKGRIAEAVKISRNANFIDTTVQKLPVRYEVPLQTRQFEFHPEPLKPMLISRVPAQVLPQYNISLGVGLNGFFTTHLSAGSDRSSRHQWGLEFDHFNFNGQIDDMAFDRIPYFKNRIEGHYKFFPAQRKWSFDNRIHAGFEGLRYYGIFNNDFPAAVVLDEEDFRQLYTELAWEGELKLLKENEKGHQLEKIKAGFTHFRDHFGNAENRIHIDQTTRFDLSGQFFHLGTDLEYFRTDFDSASTASNSFFRLGLHPYLDEQWNDLHFRLGAQFGWNGQTDNQLGETNGEFYLLPDFSAEYRFVPGYLSAFANWKGSITNQSYRLLTAGNPFVFPGLIQAATEKTWIEGGLSGRILQPSTFRLLARYTLANALPLYYRPGDYVSANTPGFTVLYDNVDIFSLIGEIGYRVQKWNLSGRLEYSTYDTDVLPAAFHLPEWQFQAKLGYRISDKLSSGLGIDYLGARTAFIESDFPGWNRSGTLDPFVDLHLDLEYRYNDYLSARIDLDNILGQNYDLWYGYPVFGFQAGLTLSYRF